MMFIPEPLVTDLINAADAVIESGGRMRTDPGGHELALAALCNAMGRIAEYASPLEGPEE